MKDSHFIKMARVAAESSTCISHKVGCVLVKDNRVISTGRNGSPSGHEHCCDHFRRRWGEPTFINGRLEPMQRSVHREWSRRHEVHAEANAIAYAARAGVGTEGTTLFCTLSPCADCQKLIVAAGIKRVVYLEEYDTYNDFSTLKKSRIKVVKYDEEADISVGDVLRVNGVWGLGEVCTLLFRKLSRQVRMLRG